MRRPDPVEAKIRRRLGAVISARSEAKGLGAPELARAAEVDDRQMARVLAGRAGLSFHSLKRVGAALGTTGDDLLREAYLEPARLPSRKPQQGTS